MPKKVFGRLDNLNEAIEVVRDLIGAGFECENLDVGAGEEKRPLVAASARNEIMADRAVVILKRYGAEEIDEQRDGEPPPPTYPSTRRA